jgi:3-dehydroquinate synthetase
MKIMSLDKKRVGDKIRFVLPVRAGKVVLRDISLQALAKDAYWRFG